MSAGKRDRPAPALSELRSRSQAAVAAVPESVRRLHQPERYAVRFGAVLQASVDRMSSTKS
jgi:hypothetical protein